MGKKVSTINKKELAIPIEAFTGELVITFPQSQVFAYVYALAAAKNADIYAEGMIGNRLHHIACFKDINDKLNTIFPIIQMLHHTKGIQVFLRGNLLNPWKVFDVLSCFKSAKSSSDIAAYCSIFINEKGLPCGPDVHGNAAGMLPCRLLAGRAYQRFNNSLGTKSQIISALAAQEEIYWCPYFVNREEFSIPIEPPDPYIEGETE
ncbi:hypothetical protein [Phytobacter diazotrophicus]|uniref:hypothetical protein n=1 Tax=Phytobacter diazotrophicus TaxID=395631 RepID=UPI002FF67160